MVVDYKIAGILIFFIILISIQYTLNRIFSNTKEIVDLLHLLVNKSRD